MFYVYEALNADGASVYIGVTNNVKRRISEHKHHASWFMAAAEWRVLGEYEDNVTALRAEWAEIGSRRPMFNIRANTADTASLDGIPENPHIKPMRLAVKERA